VPAFDAAVEMLLAEILRQVAGGDEGPTGKAARNQ